MSGLWTYVFILIGAAARVSHFGPMYTIRAELERGGSFVERAETAAEALDRMDAMQALKVEISGPHGEPLTKNDLLVHLSREARKRA